MLCRLKSCGKCDGDLVLDGDEWRCWQCGRYYYPQPMGGSEVSLQDRTVLRDINRYITAQRRIEDGWWLKNRETISHLDEARSTREISQLVRQGQRRVRFVREQLNEMREK